MARVNHDDQVIPADDGGHSAELGLVTFDEADVRGALADPGEHLRGVGDLDSQDDVGRFPVQGAEPVRQQVLGHRQ